LSIFDRSWTANRTDRQTSSPNILYRRAQRLRRLTGNKELKSQGQIEQSDMTFSQLASQTMLRPLKMTFSDPIVIAINAYLVRSADIRVWS
jgi:DHA1 family multidrug resistance protein-like MFS transporter